MCLSNMKHKHLMIKRMVECCRVCSAILVKGSVCLVYNMKRRKIHRINVLREKFLCYLQYNEAIIDKNNSSKVNIFVMEYG